MEQTMLAELSPADLVPTTTWFDGRGCVVLGEEGTRQVFVGGRLLGSFGAKDYVERSLLLIAVSEAPRSHFGHIAGAFGVSSETVRLLRRLLEREGIAAVARRTRGGSVAKRMTAGDRRKLVAAFEQGKTGKEAWETIRRRASRSTVLRLKSEWEARERPVHAEPVAEAPAQMSLIERPVVDAECVNEAEAAVSGRTEESPTEDEGASSAVRSQPVTSGRCVQYVGTWLLLGMLDRQGLHEASRAACADTTLHEPLRIATDAFVCALAIGEGCVEGVRRVMTASGSALLRANRAPSATWVRRIWGTFAADHGAARLHLAMARRYVCQAHAETERDVVVFYIDNHLRPYTGQQTIRKGWRMQDKRVRPGVTDAYVHDEVGNPVLRVADAANGSLTTWLPPIAKLLRDMVGPEPRILLAFDRGGAFAEQLVGLRNCPDP